MALDPARLRIVTYNILFSRNATQIVQNLVKLARAGVDVFCLQEVTRYDDRPFIIDELLAQLNSNGETWAATGHLGEERTRLGMGTYLVWNTARLQLSSEAKFELPKREQLHFHEWLFAKVMGGAGVSYQRRSITGQFAFQGQEIRISSLHLDHIGGIPNRQNQLKFFLEQLATLPACPTDIIAGDFNSFDLLKTKQELKAITATLGPQFIDAAAQIPWTGDLYDVDLSTAWPITKFAIRVLHIHIQRKLDYLWVKGWSVKHCEKVLATGSDHSPLVAELELL